MKTKFALRTGMFPAIRFRVRRFWDFGIFCAGAFAFCAPIRAEGLQESTKKFVYRDSAGRVTSVKIVRHYWSKPIVHPFAKVDPRLDPRLARAATLAEERAHANSQASCWHYVKHALFSAGVISSYPKTAYAAEAGDELMRSYGFRRLPIRDPYKAPIGAVLVYGNKNHGHVEIRTEDGFVSDYRSKYHCSYPLIAVYGKFGG
ncbi:MAG TPA: hypothetical protein VG103_03985 [Chthoniobacterales bacterium]|nr:hypothetical protein [Chthoniobacterales bacterium]